MKHRDTNISHTEIHKHITSRNINTSYHNVLETQWHDTVICVMSHLEIQSRHTIISLDVLYFTDTHQCILLLGLDTKRTNSQYSLCSLCRMPSAPLSRGVCRWRHWAWVGEVGPVSVARWNVATDEITIHMYNKTNFSREMCSQIRRVTGYSIVVVMTQCTKHYYSQYDLLQSLASHLYCTGWQSSYNLVKGKFLYCAVASPQYCSKHFKLYSLTDMFNQTPSPHLWEAINGWRLRVQISTTVYSQILVHVEWNKFVQCFTPLHRVWTQFLLVNLLISLPLSHCNLLVFFTL